MFYIRFSQNRQLPAGKKDIFHSLFFDMISFEKAKKILTSQGRKYSDDEIKIIMNTLQQLAYFEYTFLKNKKSEIGKGINLYKGKYGRTI